MEQVMKHYGNAILAVIVLLALGAIIVAALSSVDKGKQALKRCLREKRVCLCEPVLQPHQTHAFAAQAAGDVFAGAERAGAILEALGKSAP